MPDALSNNAFVPKVGIARLPSPSYPPARKRQSGFAALSRLADTLGWSDERGRSAGLFQKALVF